jgi:hypothetical protein
VLAARALVPSCMLRAGGAAEGGGRGTASASPRWLGSSQYGCPCCARVGNVFAWSDIGAICSMPNVPPQLQRMFRKHKRLQRATVVTERIMEMKGLSDGDKKLLAKKYAAMDATAFKVGAQ